jgi:hypothetical protein
VNEPDGSDDPSLAEQVQTQNTKLQTLIDAISQIITSSRALLQRLQGGGNEEPPPPDTPE